MKQFNNLTINSIAHFNIDKHIEPLLNGDKYFFALKKSNFPKIKNPNNINKISLHSFSKANKNTLSIFPNLKILVTRSVGTDHIDFDYCKAKGITTHNIPDYGSYNIAEHALALILTATKNIIPANISTHQAKFSYFNYLGLGLRDKTLGVIGTGKIGKQLIKLVQNFGFKVLAFDKFPNNKFSKKYHFKYVSLNYLCQNSDIISIHVPLLSNTKYIINKNNIKLMKNNCILVNTSRGGIINEKDLLKNIHKFKYVCLDVLENELNLTNNNPILKHKNIIITPHTAFFTDNSIKSIATQTNQLMSLQELD